METLRVTTFKDSAASFTAALNEHGVEYSRRMPPLGVPMATGINIDIAVTGGWAVVAIAFLAWMRVRSSRRISVTTKEGAAIWLEGYSADEAAKIIQEARQVAVIDTKPEGGSKTLLGQQI